VWTGPQVAHWQATGQRPPVAVWTPAQTAAFLQRYCDRDLYPPYLLVALLGLRRGEVAGLRWCDVDLDGGVLMVSHQVQDHNGRTVVCPPKTDSSVRAVALDHISMGVLRRFRACCERQAVAGLNPEGFLFVNRQGEPLSPGYVTHTFRRWVAEADLPPIRLHDLRHGAASLSLAAGNDLKAVQAMLGHSSIVLTADTYTSVLPCLAHQAAEATAGLVLRAAQQTARTVRGRSRRYKRCGTRSARKATARRSGRSSAAA
jgi:integrase